MHFSSEIDSNRFKAQHFVVEAKAMMRESVRPVCMKEMHRAQSGRGEAKT